MELLSSLYYVIYNKAQKWTVIELKGFYIHKESVQTLWAKRYKAYYYYSLINDKDLWRSLKDGLEANV